MRWSFITWAATLGFAVVTAQQVTSAQTIRPTAGFEEQDSQAAPRPLAGLLDAHEVAAPKPKKAAEKVPAPTKTAPQNPAPGSTIPKFPAPSAPARIDPPPAPQPAPATPIYQAPVYSNPPSQPAYAPNPMPYATSDNYGLSAPASGNSYSPAGASAAGIFSADNPRFSTMVWSGYDTFRGISDGSQTGNNGAVTGLNLGAPVPWLEQFGIGAQLGGSYGTYDYLGRSTFETTRIQQQFFATAGLFRRADNNSPIVFGMAYDWMINDNFGNNSDEPFLSQWRTQLGYALSDANEIGVWGTWINRSDSSNRAGVGPLTYRPVSQINLYWHHTFTSVGANSWFWVGLPDKGSRGTNGTLGEFIVGTAMTAPITDRIGTYFNATYLKPSASTGVAGSAEEGFNLSAGITFYPGYNARTRSVAGSKWMPLMPVANNGTFWVDRF